MATELEREAKDKEKPPIAKKLSIPAFNEKYLQFETESQAKDEFNVLTKFLYSDEDTILLNSLAKLNQYSKTYSSQIVIILDFRRIAQIITNTENDVIISQALSLILNVSQTVTIPKLIEIISPLFNSPKLQIRISAVDIIINSIGSIFTEKQKKRTIKFLCSEIPELPPKLRNMCIQTLTQISKNEENASNIIDNIKISELLKLPSQTPNYFPILLQLIINLLPKCKSLEFFDYPKQNRPDNSNRFAKDIQLDFIRLLIDNPIHPLLTILAISSTLNCHSIQLNDDELSTILSYAADPDIAPCVLSLFIFYFKEQSVNQRKKNIIISVLSKAEVKPQFSKWYRTELQDLRKQHYSNDIPELTIDEIIVKLKTKQISPFEFIYSSIIDHIHELLNNDENQKEIDENLIEIISELCTECLNYFPLSPNYGTTSPQAFLSLLKSDATLQIALPTKQKILVKVPYQSSISLVEGLINEMSHFDSDLLKARISEIPEIHDSLSLAYPLQASQLSLIFRAIDPNYMALKLSSVQKEYTIHDSMLSIFCDNESRNILTCTPDKHETKSNLPQLKKPKLGFFSALFSLITLLHNKFGISVQCQKLIDKIHNSLSYPLNSIGRRSWNLTLIFKYPYLFPPKIRMLAFNLITLEPLLALKNLVIEFPTSQMSAEEIPKQSPLKVIVSRENLFNDGLKYLKMFAQNRIPAEMQFRNEPGSGPGPTKYCFNQLQEEFKKSPLFRFDQSQGLFPAPNTDPQLFQLFGIFLAKALSMDIPIKFNFNPAFIDKLKGKQISIEDVDRILAHSLKQDLVGNEFIYPGYPDMQLIQPNQDAKSINIEQQQIIINQIDTQNDSLTDNLEDFDLITVENQDLYRSLIIEKTINGNIDKCCAAFIKGFNSVIPFMLFERLFTSIEISNLFSNDIESLSYEELESYTQLIGFSKDDPQIISLFTQISQMSIEEVKSFLRFVTGLDFLPQGGLKEFQPPLSIQRIRNSHMALPTASTCCNLLNLPVYQSEEEQYSKIKEAITYCHMFYLG